jgi:hypothetical protein
MSNDFRKKSVYFDSFVTNNDNRNEDFYLKQKRTGSVFIKFGDLNDDEKYG